MAFVPGRKHDLFLSYAHTEGGWAETFRKDSRNLRLGQKWAAEIEEGIRSAAAFLAIVCPSYPARAEIEAEAPSPRWAGQEACPTC